MADSSSGEQEIPMQIEEEEDDVDQLLAGVQEPLSSKPKLNRLKRARVVDKVTEVPASKRCEVEDEAALPASPSIHMAEASKDSTPVPSASRSNDSEEANERAAKSARADRQQQTESGAGDDYWDEEDELEEYVMRRDLGQIKDDNAEGSGSDSEGSAQSSKGRSDDDADSDDGAMDTKELAAETQRILRDAARSDRIGKGAAPEIQPLSGVLAKIMQRKEEAISRAARIFHKPNAAKTPEQRVKQRAKQPVSASPLEEDDGDLLLVDSDEDEKASRKAAKRVLAQEESQLFGLESQSLPDKPSLATSTTPAQTQPKPRTGLMSFMQRGPLLDTQDLFGSEPVAPKIHVPASETEAAAAAMDADTEGPVLNLCLDTETQAEQPVQLASCMQGPEDEPISEEQGTNDEIADEEGIAEEAGGEEEEEHDEEEGPASDDEGHADDEGEEDEEEEFLSSNDSSSDEEDAEAEPALDSASKLRALEEARALLRDEPRKKNKSAYFEDEAEMSEDGGHSDDGDSDGDNDEQDGILEDLIGLENDGKHDEKRRAALHAAWLERQDEAAVEQLMNGVKNGFRRKRNALDDEGGTNYEAALRRAALMNTDDEGSDEDGSESEEEAQADPFENIDALSDEEAKEELREAQQRRLMEESQKEEDNIVTLLDDESRAVLGLLQRGAASAAVPPPVQPLRPSYQSDMTNRPSKGSFFKRGSSSNPMALLAKSGSQMGNTRSFVFGCENSNSGVVAADSQPQGSGSQVPLTAGPGPTSFAGIHVGASAAGIRSGEAEKPSNLLGMLHTKMRSKAGTAQPEKDAAAVQMRSIMTGKKTKHTLARKF